MKLMKNIVLVFGAVAFLAAATPAMADTKNMTFGVLDMNKALQDTDAAKGALKEMNAKFSEYKDQTAKEEKSLRADHDAIASQEKNLSAADFDKKRKDFETKMKGVQMKVQQRKTTLDSAFADAMKQLREQVLKAAADVAKERGYDAVFTQDALVMGQPTMDITDEVISRVNKSGQKVKVDWSGKSGK